MSWDGLVEVVGCADAFFVHYWNSKQRGLFNQDFTEDIEANRTSVEIEVIPGYDYR